MYLVKSKTKIFANTATKEVGIKHSTRYYVTFLPLCGMPQHCEFCFSITVMALRVRVVPHHRVGRPRQDRPLWCEGGPLRCVG